MPDHETRRRAFDWADERSKGNGDARKMETFVVLASASTNRDKFRRIHIFEMIPIPYASIDEAIEHAKTHYRTNYAPKGTAPRFRVYESTDPDGALYALVEVAEEGSGDMRFDALYKVIANKYGFVRSPPTPEQPEASKDPDSEQPPA